MIYSNFQPISPERADLLRNNILEAFWQKYLIPKSPLFDNEAYYPLYSSDKRYNLIKGGRGSAKSYETCGKMPIVLISCLPFCRFLIMRQIYQTHKSSTYQEIIDYIEWAGLQSEFVIGKSPISITHRQTGNSIHFRGMDKPAAIKSIKDITHIVWEECFEITDDKGFDVVDKSVRTLKLVYGGCSKMYIPFNPDNTNHWLYDRFYDENSEKAKQFKYYRQNSLYLTTTYRDNKFVHPNFITLIEADRVANPERYKVDGLGEWGRLKETGLFYRYFDYEEIVEEGLKQRVYDPKQHLHISFDFNVYPYITLEVTQMVYNEQADQIELCNIDEICLTDKDNTGDVQKTVIEFMKRYKDHKGLVVVCGDRAGHSKKTNAIPDFATIFAMLKKTAIQDYINQKDDKGHWVRINPYPDYEQLGCKFTVSDGTIRSQNPKLEIRQAFFERLHQGKLKVLPIDRKYGTINASGQRRGLSEQYHGARIVQKIDAMCKFLINDYQELKEDVLKGGKSTRKAELSHTSDAIDYQYCQLLDCEFAWLSKEMNA